MDDFKTKLSAAFKVKIIGTLTNFIGWKLHHISQDIYVNQTNFVDRMLAAQNHLHVESAATLYILTVDLSFRHFNEAVMLPSDHHHYRLMVGYFVFLTVCTHVDISFAASNYSSQLHDPRYWHFSLTK